MTKVEFPALIIPAKIKAGVLLDATLLGVGLKIPPVDINLFGKDIVVWEGFTLFDTDDISTPIGKLTAPIPQAVWDLFENTINTMVEDYYEAIEKETK